MHAGRITIIVALAAVVVAGTAQAQSTYGAPAWGQYGTSWGAYSGTIGQHGWRYGQTLRPNEPTGTILVDPNQLTSSFDNPRTGARLFTPPDTRLRGRDRP